MTQTVVFALILAFVALAIWAVFRRRRESQEAMCRRAAFIRGYMFPGGLRFKMRQRFPALSDDQITEIFEGLRTWFLLLLAHPKQKFGMPSKAVDTAWHEFILMTRNYEAFCRDAFGRFLHHVPHAGSVRDSQAALARTWGLGAAVGIGAGALVGTVAAANLFSIDQSLGIDGGQVYDAAALDELRRKHEEHLRNSGSGGDASVSDSDERGSNLDQGGSDGGSDGGGGCGGGCGS
jgi:hypothetical protein